MRNSTSALSFGNLLPIKKEVYFLSTIGNLFPTKYISKNFYKEDRALFLSLAFENAQDGSNLTIVARNNFPFPVQIVVCNLIRSYVHAFQPLLERVSQYHNGIMIFKNTEKQTLRTKRTFLLLQYNAIILKSYEVIISYFRKISVELEIHRNYNNYRTIMNDDNNGIKDLLAEARAIHLAMRYGQITYEEAKSRVQPILLSVNAIVRRIARQHKVKPRFITFQDLGRML